MWRIILNVLGIIGLVLALIVVTKMLSVTHEDYYGNRDIYLYDTGNANADVRKEITDQLQMFQDGFTARDTSVIGSYMDQLFSRENVLILGAMPNEIYSGFTEATDLVQSDWLYWGDVRFLMDQSHISVRDSVAWVATIGKVQFDMSRFLVLPLRFSGVLVKEQQTWKFQQAQFQFDLDFSWILAALVLLSLMLIASIIRLVYVIIKY